VPVFIASSDRAHGMIREGKFDILERDSVGHCEQISSYEHVPNSEWLSGQSCWNLKT
jgi:hypothetical protein